MGLHRGARTSALLIALVLPLAACGGGDEKKSADEPTQYADGTQITIWADPARTPVVNQIGQVFTEKTNAKVKVVQTEFGTMLPKFQKKAPSGSGPDVLLGSADWTGQLAKSGSISPVELENPDDFAKVSTRAYRYDGESWGLPLSMEAIGLVRNTALAKSAPESWNDLVSQGDAINRKNKRVKHSMMIQQDVFGGDPLHLYPLQSSFGSTIFGTNADGEYQSSDLRIGDSSGQAFAQWLATAGKKKQLVPGISYDYGIAEFTKGRTPFMVTGPWALGAFDDAKVKYAVSPVPAAGDQPGKSLVSVQGFMVSAYSQEAKAAQDFVTNYLSTPDAQEALVDATVRPAAMTGLLKEQTEDDAAEGAFGDIATDGEPLPNLPAMQSVWPEWGKAETAIISGRPAAKQWKSMAKAIQQQTSGQ